MIERRRLPPCVSGPLAPAVLLLGALILAGCDEASDSAAVAAPPPPPRVGVVEVKPAAVTRSVEFVGRVEAVDSVEIRARVEGYLASRGFTEGTMVKKGDVLFAIERERYEAIVAQAEAALASAVAAQRNTAVQLERGEALLRRKNVSQSQVDELAASDQMAQAQIQAAEATLAAAEIDLGYTEIRAPIAGRIGRSAFTEGALVNPASGVLATIVSQDPIYVTFPVSQRQILELRRQPGTAGAAAEKVVVKLRLADGSMYDRPGVIDFVDNQVQQGTDTLTVRASLPNPEGLLTPGQFATVVVESKDTEQALVIPQSALQIDQAGAYVLVVGEGSKADLRRVTTGPVEGSGIVVEQGLEAGDTIVVEGIQRVRPGSPVTVQAAAEPAATGS